MPMANALYRLVREVTGTDLQVEMASRAGVDQTAISRWKKGLNFSTDNAIAVARALGISPVEALVKVGLITEDEADVVVRLVAREEPTNDELLEILRSRLVPDGSESAAYQAGARAGYAARFVGDQSPTEMELDRPQGPAEIEPVPGDPDGLTPADAAQLLADHAEARDGLRQRRRPGRKAGAD